MSTRTRLLAAAVLATAVLVPHAPAVAGDTQARASKTQPATKAGIQWFATWAQAKAEAKRTQRPILFTSAAPHCRNISGMW